MLAIVSTVIAVPGYAALRFLGRSMPVPAAAPATRGDDALTAPPIGAHRRSVRFVAYFLTIYRRSYLHAYLHRGKAGCRFVPCCAEYALLAVEKHGLVRGLRLAGGRIARCKPGNAGDYLDFP